MAKKNGYDYLLTAIIGALVIAIVKYLWPKFIPLDVWNFWSSPSGIWEGVLAGWPILAWGAFNGARSYIHVDREYAWGKSAGATFLAGLKKSLWGGITEEIAFRWLIHLGAMPGIALINYLLFGFAGFGIPEWFHVNVWGALSNWTTFGMLEPQIFDPNNWFVGAAILYANALFREGHTYQGLFGYINSWFLGMGFFWIVFHYGLPAAIAVHVLHNLLIYLGHALGIAKY